MDDRLLCRDVSPTSPDFGSSSGSNSSSTGEEERLRRLFNSCDGDGDGFLCSDDFIYMCRQLNMEDMAEEIMEQLGLQSQSKITFQDFLRFRGQVQNEELDLSLGVEDQGIDSDLSGALRNPDNVTSWPTMSSDSFGAYSGKPDSLDYDSGARDMSPEPASLHHLVESHNPKLLSLAQDDRLGTEILDVANRLHLAALTSLKGEIIELNNRLHHVTSERDVLEKQINRIQADKVRLQHECDTRIEITTGRYEERITELHSVIAELRKKIERHHINVIREEDEYEDAAVQSNKSNDGGSRAANDSQASGLDILGNDLNTEMSRVVTALDNVIENQPMKTGQDTVEEGCNTEEALCDIEDNDSVEELALQACKQMDALDLESPPSPPPRGLRPATFHPPPPPPPNEYPDPAYLQEVIFTLRQDAMVLQETVQRQEAELNMHRAAIGSLREERDKLRQRVHEIRTEQMSPQHLKTSPQASRTSTPTKNQPPHTPTERSQMSNNETFPVAKVAELKKLKTCSNERPVLGCELESGGRLPNTKVAEHLVQNIQEGSNMQEIVQNLYTERGELGESKVQEFEIEFERLQSKIDSLKSQNDLLNLTLMESKSLSDRLCILIGKYESNNTALQLALNYSDQTIEAYDVVLSLTESELGLTLSNCRSAGVTQGLRSSAQTQEEINQLAQKSRNTRKTAENVARHLIQKLDRNFGVNPWDDSSTHTASTSSSGCYSEDFSKAEEQKLREYIHQLKTERASIKSTVMELESLNMDAPVNEPTRQTEACRLDLENAVLMQELMAMKEEKAELRAQNYLLEKEKNALELRLSGKETREQADVIQIEHLKSEMEERNKSQDAEQQHSDSSPLADKASRDLPEGSSQDLSEALQRERKLKSRVQELVVALEKLSRNSEIRHQQSAEFVNDHKRANNALITVFEKTKRKYQGKLKKLEFQIQALTERYEAQIHMLKQRLLVLENNGIPPNETSL
ncbi:colorectal mutant cancer protein-like isoform X2 [Saccostrea echinata]|uniref:colorectal mutant cancer protein-like isoform X2 n=1 Tax=Saccostrea echinata TaxID=191078 RepID=UPI002A7FB8B2|nr:colorectal mutant cancer protein-like isoform X2 [Saccostrea echinata]